MMWWKYAEKITIFIMPKKCESVMLQKTELASIRHHTAKRQCKAIMRIRKMQALRNENARAKLARWISHRVPTSCIRVLNIAIKLSGKRVRLGWNWLRRPAMRLILSS